MEGCVVVARWSGGLTVELSCGPATPTRKNNRHCTGLTVSAAHRAARQLQRLVRQHTRLAAAPQAQGDATHTPDNHLPNGRADCSRTLDTGYAGAFGSTS